MSKRALSVSLVAFSLLIIAEGCKKRGPVPPPPPPKPKPVEQPKPAPPKPTISRFVAEPSTIERGKCSTLRWSTSGATNVSISQGVGPVAADGNREVCPTSTTTYTLTANGPGGTSTSTATVTVTTPQPAAPPPPKPKEPSLSELVSQLNDAFFDYDKSDIREDARAVLTRNADQLKSILSRVPSAVITIEGHCDERGSAEYNLGLGDRRSTAAKEFLTQLGVSAGQLRTVSYGKERPSCTESNEDCWQRNRRVHFSAQ
jgi:peptidoglycan-associated lipoprotein